jgi:uncharacterized membrane-anchored protein YitT (DUF2179 family)
MPELSFGPLSGSEIRQTSALNSEVMTMRITLIVLGVLLMFFGAVWFFQGINVLPGSFMTGQTQWAVYGGTAFVVGVFVLYRSWRKRPPSQRS